MKIICVDIGNSFIKIGSWQRGRFVSLKRVPTACAGRVKTVCSSRAFHAADAVVVCSVVPAAERVVVRSIAQVCACPVFVIGKNCVVAIATRYRSPAKLGRDRRVAIAGTLLTQRIPAVVVSFGTAITIDVIDARGMHRGGCILPGLKTAARALSMQTAALPHVALRQVRSMTAIDTVSAIRTGVVIGTAGAIEMIVKAYGTRYGAKTVIATGGDARLLKRLCPSVTRVDPYLVLRTLAGIGCSIVKDRL